MPANLNRKQQREIKAVVERAKKDNGIPQTAQQSIPFQRMFPDGICRVTDSYYTKTIQFQDINYQLAQQEDKTAIFDEWCSFLNFFDSSIHFELSFMNLSTDAESFEKSIRIPFKKDSFNPVRAEYSQMLKKQLAQGNNGLTKTKYLTFGIEAESMRQAKPRLNHIENDLLNNFRRLGVIATTMNGKERLHLMHSMPCMRSSKRTTPMPLLIPFPDGNKNRQSKRSMQRRRQAKGQRKKLPLKQQRKQPKAPKRLQRKRWSFAPHTLKRSCLF